MSPGTEWKVASGSAYRWIQMADRRYIAARFLYWKGFWEEFALVGGHAMELYLKAYLIHKTDKYPSIHDLTQIYNECMKCDDFFKDESLQRNFLSKFATWPHYFEVLRYPEPLPGKSRPKGVGAIIGVGGTHQVLDYIAHFVRDTVDRSPGQLDVIDDLIKGNSYTGVITHGTLSDLPEIRRLFLYDNGYFTP